MALVPTVLAAWAPPAAACSVPVFRYALERWPADPYRVAIFHRGPLAGADKQAVETLKKAVGDGMGPGANLLVRTVDLTGEVPASMQALWGKYKGKALPHMVVLYPPWTVKGTVWTGRLTGSAVKGLLDSPARKEIVKRIIGGESAVWVLLECGNKKSDDAAAKLLTAQLAKLVKAMKVPEGAEAGIPEAGDTFGEADLPPVRVDFSVLRLSRKAAGEQVFVKMLLGTEEDLTQLAGPMTFPIFGRGRALYALVNKGINEANITEACGFLVGPCSCQIKQQNPGVYILMVANWEAGTGPAMVVPKSLPPLTGIGELIDPSKANAPTTRAATRPATRPAVTSTESPANSGRKAP